MVRILSALVLIALVLATLWLLPAWATTIVAAVVAALAGVELAHLAAKVGADVPAAFVGLASAVLTVAVAAPHSRAPGAGAEVSAAALLMLVVAAGAIALAWGPPSQSTFARAAVLSMAPTYVGLPLGAIAWVQVVSGPLATTWLLGTMALSDSAQFYTGRLLGRTRLAPAISPAKTVEGAVGGLVAAGVGGSILGPLCVPGLSPLAGALVGLGLAVAGMAGDLFESLLKRSAGVKDSSTLIPGHGGVLDRIDSHLFAAPVFYVFLAYFR
jgi:phosphatidate cytidylyltransferase